jgi:DNA-binding NtrC family response regulator
LLHAIEAAMVVCEGERILPEHLPAALRNSAAAAQPGAPAGSATLPSLEEMERRHIRLALEACGGHRGNAAKALGISERNLYRKLRDHGLLS